MNTAIKQCQFCMNNARHIDYKDLDILRKYIDLHARAQNHRRTGVCAHHQKKLITAIKHARHMALLPFTAQ